MSGFRKTKISQIDRLEEALGVQSATVIGSRIVVDQIDTNLYRFRILSNVPNPVLSIVGGSEEPIFNHNTLTDELEVVTELTAGFHEIAVIEGNNIRIPAPDGGGGGGNYRLTIETNNIVIGGNVSTVNIDIPTYNPDIDVLVLYEGGKFQTAGSEYFIDFDLRTISKPSGETWIDGDVLDILIFKNIALLPEDLAIDGYMIMHNSIPIEALAPSTMANLATVKFNGYIPTTGWVAHTIKNPFKLDLEIGWVTTNHDVTIDIDEEYQDIAKDAEINLTCVEYNGGVTIFAKSIPEEAIPVKYTIKMVKRLAM
jgi:hypothetical protein